MSIELSLITLYDYVCKSYNEELCYEVQRFSNNRQARNKGITDEELITIYLFCLIKCKFHKLNAMHEFITTYWSEWFPLLPSYPVFVTRLNTLRPAFEAFTQRLCKEIHSNTDESCSEVLLGDSMPIITCSHKRKAKIATEIVNRGYCASKDLHYFGVKLNLFSTENPNHLPKPKYIGVTSASTHDLNASREVLERLNHTEVFLDKAYNDSELQKDTLSNKTTLFIPPKTSTRTTEELKKRDKAYNDLFATAVAKRRQPIEACFAWMQSQLNIHIASKVRSTNALFVLIYGAIVAAIIKLFILDI